MFYSLKGKLRSVKSNFAVVESGSFGYKIFLSEQSLKKLPDLGKPIQLFLYLYLREESAELFGFLSEEELEFFEVLNTVSGIGPKLALGVLGLAPVKKLKAAISQGKTEVLTKTFGIGRKTAERIILELKDKIKDQSTKTIGDESEVFEVLIGLGFTKKQAREAISRIAEGNFKSVGEKIKAALKEIK